MKIFFFASLLFPFMLLSCTGRKDTGVITFQLSKSDYVEKINVSGTVQAVVNVPVMAPSRMMGQMRVARLAEDGAYVKTGDTICVLALPELISMYSQALNSIETLEAGLKKTEADNKLKIALLEAQLATSEAQLKISSLDSLRMQYAPEVNQKLLKLEMKKVLIEKQKTEKKLAATKSIGQTEIRQMNARILSEKARTQTMADQVRSLTIIAQREGIVTRTESPVFTIMGPGGIGKMGGPIREGSMLFMNTPVLQFPDLTKMQISAEVQEADFKKIEKGQKVKIDVDAAQKLETTGRVNRKSLIGRNAMRYSESKVKFYEIIIDVDSCHSRMKPGLSAYCEITLKEAKDTLFVPTLSIFERDSSKVVYVLGKNNFSPVKVETGMSGSSHTIITAGLNGDEVIALTEPPNSLIRSEERKSEKPDTLKNHNTK
jgi:multidrug efflux pump subunit AcrA (membrane-fusion protein)